MRMCMCHHHHQPLYVFRMGFHCVRVSKHFASRLTLSPQTWLFDGISHLAPLPRSVAFLSAALEHIMQQFPPYRTGGWFDLSNVASKKNFVDQYQTDETFEHLSREGRLLGIFCTTTADLTATVAGGGVVDKFEAQFVSLEHFSWLHPSSFQLGGGGTVSISGHANHLNPTLISKLKYIEWLWQLRFESSNTWLER